MSLSAEDHLEILELLARADNAASDRDVTAYVALLTQDAVMDGEKGEFHGRDAIGRAVGPVWASEGETTVHLTLNAVIVEAPEASGDAVARSTLMIVRPVPHPEIVSLSAITHRIIKVDERWSIARRTVGAYRTREKESN
jgi:hypothetical protein